MPPQTPRNPWQRRLSRLFYFLGAAGTFYLVSSYALDRMREARVRALREKKERDLLKSHFTTLLSTISFTLYALLPTLSPQLESAYPVEQTSQALQGLSQPSSSQISSAGEVEVDAEGRGSFSTAASAAGDTASQDQDGAEATYRNTPDSSLVLDAASSVEEGASVHGVRDDSPARSAADSRIGESWSSAFHRQGGVGLGAGTGLEGGMESSGLVSMSGMSSAEGEDGASSVISQTISLPPTDLSTSSGSPPSDVFSSSSNLHPSPPRERPVPSTSAIVAARQDQLGYDLAGKSKKELWRDLKIQSISRAMTTAYLLPLLYILTTSQLSTLARTRYLLDLKTSLAPPPPKRHSIPTPTAEPTPKSSSSWIPFSLPDMGLGELATESASLIPNPISLLPGFVSARLPSFLAPAPAPARPGDGRGERQAEEVFAAERAMQEEADRAEAERLYLTYSWWILHEGWKAVAARVEEQVERVFGGMALKRELGVDDWAGLILEVQRGVEAGRLGAEPSGYESVLSSLLPPTPIPPTSTYCPLPLSPPSPYLSSLLSQTRAHLASPDARLLLDRGVSTMTRTLLESLRSELYASPGELLLNADGEGLQTRRRLVDCLPALSRWAKGTWEGIPDTGVEAVLALREFEGFAALVFGDWAGEVESPR